MALKIEVDTDPMQESSLENSADGELLGMVDEGSYESGDHHHFLEEKDTDTTNTYHFRNITGGLTYKILQMGETTTTATIPTHSPNNSLPGAEYYVIEEPVQVYGTAPVQKQKVIKKNPTVQPTKVVTAKKRDDKRRATHNEVERRRRDKINSWITNLAALVPNSGLPDSASKGGILAKACDYITELTQKQKRLDKLEVDNEKLVLEILKLNEELSELRKENSSLRTQLADNCIVTSLTHRPKGQKS